VWVIPREFDPHPAYDHGWMGYREFIEEEFGQEAGVARSLFPAIIKRQSVGRNDLCPCGSGVKYKRCHLWLVDRIQKRVGTRQLLWGRALVARGIGEGEIAIGGTADGTLEDPPKRKNNRNSTKISR
jgi:hypothetical protein